MSGHKGDPELTDAQNTCWQAAVQSWRSGTLNISATDSALYLRCHLFVLRTWTSSPY